MSIRTSLIYFNFLLPSVVPALKALFNIIFLLFRSPLTNTLINSLGTNLPTLSSHCPPGKLSCARASQEFASILLQHNLMSGITTAAHAAGQSVSIWATLKICTLCQLCWEMHLKRLIQF